MKQNGQWLSHVRTRSNTALASSTPSGAPVGLVAPRRCARARPAALRARRAAPSACSWYAMTSRRSLAVDREDLVAGGDARAARPAIRARRQRLVRGASAPVLRADRRTPRAPSLDARRSARGRARQVLLAEPRGFCAGVEMAIKALAWMVRAFEPPVYCYHEIVHNRLVVERFREQGVVFVDDVAEVPPGAPLMLSAHGSAPEVVAAAARRGPLRRERGVPARHQGAPRGEGAGPQGLHDPLRRPRRPRRSGRHARGRARRDPPGRARRRPRRACSPRSTTRARSRCSRRRRSPTTSGPACSTQTRDRVPASCGPRRATTSASRRPTARPRSPRSRSDADAVVVIGSANSSNTHRAREGRARRRAAAIVLRVDGPDELDLDALGGARVVGVTAGASAPEELVDAVIAEARAGRRRRSRCASPTRTSTSRPAASCAS